MWIGMYSVGTYLSQGTYSVGVQSNLNGLTDSVIVRPKTRAGPWLCSLEEQTC